MALGIQLREGLTRGDPLLTFQWVARSMPFPGLTPAFIETFEIPFNNVKSENVFSGGGYNYFPGFHDVSAFNVTFYGDSGGKSLKWLSDWKNRIKDFDTGIYQLPSNYKRTWEVALVDNTGSAVIDVTLSGCWPADTASITLDYNDGAGKVTFNQNFSLDNASIKIVGGSF